MPRLTATLTLIAALAAVGPARGQDMPGNNETARRAVHVCASCHGAQGRSTNPQFPSLAGQSAQYTAQQLKDFRTQQRSEADNRAYMWGVSALLDDAAIDALAEYYAAQTPAKGHVHAKVPHAVLVRGQQLFEQGNPARGVRACASCHGTRAEGASGFPRLAGQHSEYVYQQLVGFGSKLRPHGVLMKQEVAGMSKANLRAVALYLQSL